MKVILYMAVTANGYIAKANDETPWSEAEWKSFQDVAGRVKNIVVGRKTYEIMKEGKEFDKIGNPFVVIVSSKEFDVSENEAVVESPKTAIELLEEKGFSEVLVAGGGKLNGAFMKDNLIDEIFLDVEPFIFGKGIKLFSDEDFEAKLELIKINKISDDEIQLHYKIRK